MRRLLARARELLARLAFWRKRDDVVLTTPSPRRAPVIDAPRMQPGEFVVRIRSGARWRQVARFSERDDERAAVKAKDAWRKRAGAGAELWDCPSGTPRRRA
jgi:hypothetical protein